MTSTSTSGPERLPKSEMSVRPLEMQLRTIERKAARPFGECPSWWTKRDRCQLATPLHDLNGAPGRAVSILNPARQIAACPENGLGLWCGRSTMGGSEWLGLRSA